MMNKALSSILSTTLQKQNHAHVCVKKPLRYRLIHKTIDSVQEFNALIKHPLTLIPYALFAHLFAPSKRLATKLPGDSQPEMVFTVKEVVDRVLVVGPLLELYHANLSKFTKLKESKSTYIPIQDDRLCTVPIDNELFHIIRKLVKEENKNAKLLHIPTSWGATHILKRGDMLVLDKKGVYRIQGKVFKITYMPIVV